MRPPLTALTAETYAHDLRKLATIYPCTEEERDTLVKAAGFLIRQAAALAEVRAAIEKD